MPSHRHDASLIAGAHVHGVGTLGVPGNQIPATGEFGPSALYKHVTLPAQALNEFMMQITALPVGLTSFTAFEDGSYEADGVNGSYQFTYTALMDGVPLGSFVETFTIGPAVVIGGSTGNISPLSSGVSQKIAPASSAGLIDLRTTVVSAQLGSGLVIGGSVGIIGTNGLGVSQKIVSVSSASVINLRGTVVAMQPSNAPPPSPARTLTIAAEIRTLYV